MQGRALFIDSLAQLITNKSAFVSKKGKIEKQQPHGAEWSEPATLEQFESRACFCEPCKVKGERERERERGKKRGKKADEVIFACPALCMRLTSP